MRTHAVSSLLFAALSLSAGCTWVTDADVEALKGQVDDDGDGVVKSEDCNDKNAEISTAAKEVWYDGIDEDCAGGDDFDQDGDGRVPDEYQGLPTDGVKGSGELKAGDCDDTDPVVSPKQPDDYYDGIDQDCGGEDDYDSDEDHFVAAEHAGKVTKYVEGSGNLAGGDCDDELPGVNPEGRDPVDTYDGIDQNCDGREDYDKDQDGYIPDEYIGLATTYVKGSGHLPTGDCDDAAATENPGAAEIWHDGVDQACDGHDDYDQDADGYVADANVGLATADVEGSGLLPGGDCDDGAGGGAIHPRANEVRGDSLDQDCDGSYDGFAARDLVGWSWESPKSPVFGAADGYIFLSLSVGTVDVPGGNAIDWYESGYALKWADTELANDPEFVGQVAWSGNSTLPPYTASGPQDVKFDSDYLYGAIALTQSNGDRSIQLVAWPLGSGTVGHASPQAGVAPEPFEDVAIAVDADSQVWAVGCDGGGNGVLTYVRVDELPGASNPTVFENVSDGSAYGSTCAIAIDGADGRIYTDYQGGLYEYDFDATALYPTFTGTLLSPTYDPDAIVTPHWGGTTLVVADAAIGRVVLYDLAGDSELIGASGDHPLTASAWQDTDGTYAIAWANEDGTARLAIGSPEIGWEYIDISTGFDVIDVATYGANGTIAYAAVGANNLGLGFIE